MSAIALPVTTTTRLRLTARGRRVLLGLAALPAAVVLAAAVIGGGSALASHSAGAPADAFSSITVAAGDSLWSIAERVAPDADPRDVIDDIVRLNALHGAGLTAGQSLAIPAEYTAGS
ncbi:LysM peptidoglycan-binding domain-containing protein [Microbacterium fluvii]|uniref:LysM peptidoglycan-binding domain-containing protein n=1 Tax=Microbacterium fluvii TaxID=415215 RepID=A0ABW2HEY7_9MICO|nr:LysM peptidoglycan-binding domain-containing protein [Microbacterium fluvii]MCU4673513.1 LysM peptidoglycan-binding domain-containing protein [Microbacterium fluvii]